MARRSRQNRSEALRSKRSSKRKTRSSFLGRLLVLLIICILVVIGYVAISAFIGNRTADFTLTIDSAEIMQDEAIPTFTYKTTCSAKDDVVIDKENGTTVADLLAEFNNPEYVEIICDTDGKTEGEFTITATIPADLKSLEDNDSLERKVSIKTKDAELSVINKYGKWDGNRFKRYDDTYVTSDFIESKGKSYYFDENGDKVHGFMTVNDIPYHFDEDGAMTVGWIEAEDGRYYAGEDGVIYKGWLDLEGSRYFMNEETGQATVGKLELGIRECEFDETGLLIKEEWLIDPNKPTVALTFDDGPAARTAELIACLKKYNAHATFYMLGQCVPNYPETIPMMIDAGCELANHTYDHSYLSQLSPEAIQEQMKSTDDEIIKAGGHATTTMRPPGGFINDTMKENVGKPIIMWSIDTQDWKTRDAQATIDHVSKNASDGDIILMHDIHSPSIDAALTIIPMLVDRGFQLVTVSELAMVKEVRMENGEVYNSMYGDN